MSARARREHVEDEPATRDEELERRAQGGEAILVCVQVEVSAEWAGDERDALGDRRAAVVAQPKVEEPADSGRCRSLAADLEHCGRGVDADHENAGPGGGDGDPAGADTELDNGAARRAPLLDVEVDVLGDLTAPVVVESRDGVVDVHGADGTLRRVDPEALETEALSAIAAASSPTGLEAVRVRYPRPERGASPGAARGARAGGRDCAERPTRAARAGPRRAAGRARAGRARSQALGGGRRRHAPGEAAARGHLHLITQTRREVEDIFLGLGYRVVDGREVETTYYNFTALNLPSWHPARSPSASLYLDEDTVMRTETSPSQIRVMEAQQPPVYVVSLGRCYRRDTPDATHVPIFHQVEGLAVDRGISLADLKGTLLYLMRALFGEQREVRFRTHFFPFTEPSLEPDVSCFLCDGVGCAVCKHSGWIEMGGCGMVDPELYRHVGYDPEEVSGFAFGLGLERIAMLRHGLPDLRELWENDLRLLRQF